VAGHPRFRLVEGSILDAATVTGLASQADWVFHRNLDEIIRAVAAKQSSARQAAA
jgi:hypothetical protein